MNFDGGGVLSSSIDPKMEEVYSVSLLSGVQSMSSSARLGQLDVLI